MVHVQTSVHIDSSTHDRSTPGQATGVGQSLLDYLELEWGLAAIDAIVDSSQGVSETWWRVFKERQSS